MILQRETGLRPGILLQYLRDTEGARCSLIVAGWAMDHMKPRDFLWSEPVPHPVPSVGPSSPTDGGIRSAAQPPELRLLP